MPIGSGRLWMWRSKKILIGAHATMNLNSIKTAIALSTLAIVSLVTPAAAQTLTPTPGPTTAPTPVPSPTPFTQQGGWVGAGYLSGVSFPSLKPTTCFYRLVTTATSNFSGTYSVNLHYADFYGYQYFVHPTNGTTYIMNFAVPIDKMGAFASAAGGLSLQENARFAEEIRTMGSNNPNTTCEISFSYNNRTRATNLGLGCATNNPGQLAEMANFLPLNKAKVALQKDRDCN